MHHPIQAPTDPALSRRLRGVVLEHARSEHRRVFDPILYLAPIEGPAGRPPVHARFGGGDALDDALRTDMTAALLRRLGDLGPETRLLAWLTRTGHLDTQDIDLAALRALSVSAAEAGLGAATTGYSFVVANRRSWRDPVSGVGREWKRLRDRGHRRLMD